MWKLLVLGALVVAGMSTEQQPNEIDVVLNMLQDLKKNAESELALLGESWEQNRNRKQSVIGSLGNSAQQQRGECGNRDQDVSNKERDITITLSFINWLEKRIKENRARLGLLDLNRCDSNSNFINDVKNSKMLLNMIQFLRNAIRNAAEQDLPALLQRSEFQEHFQKYLKNNKIYLQLRQDGEEQQPEEGADVPEVEVDPEFQEDAPVVTSTEVEVNAEPVHQVQEQLANEELLVESDALAQQVAADPRPAHEDASNPSGNSARFTQAQQELLNVLDEIEQEVQGKQAKVQDNQVRSAMGFRDFKGLILKEVQAFNEHIVQENENLKKLQNQLITALQVTANCKARLRQITQALEFANEDLSSAEENYNNVRERLQGEIESFDDVYRIYASQVGSQSDSYKQTVQSRIRS